MKPGLMKSGSIVAGTILLATTALAQTQKGKWDLSFSGSYNAAWVSADDSDFSTDSMQVYSGTVGVGYFLTDPLEIKGNISIIGLNGGGMNAYVVPLTVGVDYHFNTKNKTVPYVGLAVGVYIVGGGFEEDSGAIGGVLGDGHAGLKQFLSEDVALDFRVGYQYAPLPGVSLNNVTASIGLSFQF